MIIMICVVCGSVMIELLKHQPNGVNADLSCRNAAGKSASELVKEHVSE